MWAKYVFPDIPVAAFTQSNNCQKEVAGVHYSSPVRYLSLKPAFANKQFKCCNGTTSIPLSVHVGGSVGRKSQLLYYCSAWRVKRRVSLSCQQIVICQPVA